jgi:putative MFS transporter
MKNNHESPSHHDVDHIARSSQPMAYSLSERFERLPFTSYQRWLAVILATCFAADAVDLVMLSYLLSAITLDLGLTVQQAGIAGGSVFAGVGIGATAAGYLSDRFGRRKVLIHSMWIWGLASLLTAFSWDIWSFSFFRFVTGLGLGAELPAVFALVAEIMPANRRASISGWMHVASQSSVVLFTLASFGVISLIGTSLGWRAMFVVMFVVALVALYVRRNLPESPRWYEASGRQNEAEHAMQSFETAVAAAYGKPLPSPKSGKKIVSAAAEQGGFRTLFAPGYTQRTLFAWSLWFLFLLAYYGISVWVGKFLVDRGMSITASIGTGVLITMAGIPAAWITGQAMERFGRKIVIILALLCVALAAFLYGQASTYTGVVAAGAVMHFFLVSVATAIYAYTPELFPTRARSTGLGTASTVGRIAAVSGPLLISALILKWDYTGAFIACALCFSTAALLVWWFGPETQDRSIEDISC